MDKLIHDTIKGLLATSKEMILSVGYKDAKEYLEMYRNTAEDIAQFWGLKEKVMDNYDKQLKKFIKQNR